jgi:transposase InsO family protein
VIRVERRQTIGARWRFEQALIESENSATLNTSFIERLNLTIRQSTAYLTRRSARHVRSQEWLEDQLEIFRFHYNFARPHRALKFGAETRTPAMQAGLTTRRLSFRDVFYSRIAQVSSRPMTRVIARQRVVGFATLDPLGGPWPRDHTG